MKCTYYIEVDKLVLRGDSVGLRLYDIVNYNRVTLKYKPIAGLK